MFRELVTLLSLNFILTAIFRSILKPPDRCVTAGHSRSLPYFFELTISSYYSTLCIPSCWLRRYINHRQQHNGPPVFAAAAAAGGGGGNISVSVQIFLINN
jgi:hypothetical protein